MKRYHRKIIHISGMLPFAVLAFYIDNGISRSVFLLSAVVFLFLIFFVEIYRLKRQHLYPVLMSKISHLYKEHEQKRFLSTVWSPIDLIILGLFFSKATILATICMGGFSDSLAAIIGMRYGRQKNKSGKTWIGSITFFVFTSLFTFIATTLIGFTMNMVLIAALALIAAILERYCTSHKTLMLDDDFLVPMVFAVLMEIGIRFFK